MFSNDVALWKVGDICISFYDVAIAAIAALGEHGNFFSAIGCYIMYCEGWHDFERY